jgi:Ca2+-binding RTX toxin-like protein
MADDYTPDTGTTGTLTIGGSSNGSFESIYDSDWFKIQLIAGQQVSFSLNASVTMAMVTLFNSNGSQLSPQVTGIWQATNPTGAVITYTPSQSGTFYLGVQGTLTGTYTVSAASGTLPIVGSGCDDYLIGTEGGDVIQGLAGNDTLYGRGGADTLNGGAGTDMAYYEYMTATKAITFVAANSIVDSSGATDTLTDIEGFSVMGSKFADTMTGGSGSDMLGGMAGADVLNGLGGTDQFMGGAGADTFNGGVGIDTVIYDFSKKSTALTFAPSAKIKDEGGAFDTLKSIEQFDVNGTAFADTLTGGSNNDIFHGGGGADTINGGNGLDTAGYVFSAATTGIVFTAGATILDEGGATDTLLSIEQFSVLGSAYNDKITGGAGADILEGAAGNDSILGNIGNDVLDGGAGNDTMNGGAGIDWINGGVGNDKLTGGAGADIFRYQGNVPTVGSDLKGDTITDFAVGVDKIGLCKVDANSILAGYQQFSFIGNADFSAIAGQLHFRTTAGNTIVEADLNGDQVAELVITLTGVKALTSDEFII